MKSHLYLLCLCLLPSLNAADHVRNGNFSEGGRFWFLFVDGTYRAPETYANLLRFSQNQLTVFVHELGAERKNPASVILNQRIRDLEEGGIYRLRFSSRADVGEVLMVGLGNPVVSGPDQGNLGGGLPLNEVVGADDWVETVLEFTYNGDQSLHLPSDAGETVLQFRMGLVGTFQLKNVSLTRK